MISRRLTKTQKAEILEAYRAGGNAIELAEEYGCSANTINRTVKTLLSDREYTILKGKRSKNSNKKLELVNNQNVEEKIKEEDQYINIDKNYDSSKSKKLDSLAIDDADDFDDNSSSEFQEKNNEIYINNQNFDEIPPLITNFEFDQDKLRSDFEIHNNYESLPESVYMIVDKKVELELKPISDLPEWSFLPDDELKRNAILLFSNQRSAKRSCSRNQKVIKIPNTSIFKLSKSYLLSKGISRLILEDSIIALDN